MSSATENWPAQSFLEGLRPEQGERVDLALLASYSADLGSIGATLLALAGKDTDSGGGSPSDFADAVESLRGKVRIVIQRGRLAKMRKTPRIAAVLDQFVREVDFDEANHSWHPKAALVRMCTPESVKGWRLWIGSRNLTECVNRDAGLLIISAEKGGAQIPGISDLAFDLAGRAEIKGVRPRALAALIATVGWRLPPGVVVERIHWMSGLGHNKVPTPTEDTTEVVVVSPFVDASFLALQSPREPTQIKYTLLTTRREIERVGPRIPAFDELLALDAPEFPIADSYAALDDGSTVSYRVGEDEAEISGRGLHAKLLFMRSKKERRLWLGSANATMRAWTGRNAEVVAELLINEQLEKGLRSLLGSAKFVPPPQADYISSMAELEEQALERARTQVAARWSAQLLVDGGNVCLTHHSDLYPEGPHPDSPDVALEVGALHGELVAWPVGQLAVELGSISHTERSEFVRLRVSSGSKGLAWLQRAPANPPFGEDRDRAAFVRFLGARGFLLWLAGLLADDGGQGEGDWSVDERRVGPESRKIQQLDSSLPTLEEMLAAWARDSDKFSEIERRVSRYLPAVLEHAMQEEPDVIEVLTKFSDLWQKVRKGLGVTESKGSSR